MPPREGDVRGGTSTDCYKIGNLCYFMNLESLPTISHDLPLQKYFGLPCGDSLIKYALTLTVGLAIEVSMQSPKAGSEISADWPVLKSSPVPRPPTQTEGGLDKIHRRP